MCLSVFCFGGGGSGGDFGLSGFFAQQPQQKTEEQNSETKVSRRARKKARQAEVAAAAFCSRPSVCGGVLSRFFQFGNGLGSSLLVRCWRRPPTPPPGSQTAQERYNFRKRRVAAPTPQLNAESAKAFCLRRSAFSLFPIREWTWFFAPGSMLATASSLVTVSRRARKKARQAEVAAAAAAAEAEYRKTHGLPTPSYNTSACLAFLRALRDTLVSEFCSSVFCWGCCVGFVTGGLYQRCPCSFNSQAQEEK
jgi:hypothetical protein